MMNRTPQDTLCTVDRRPSTVNHRRGFTFVEVLFAIIILGIGMIMLAAMLPVAISQTAQTRDQIAGKSAAEAGYAYIKAVARVGGKNAFLPTGADADKAGLMQPATSVPQVAAVTPATPANLANYKLSRVMSSDPSVQWLPFYRRDPAGNVIQVRIIAMRITGNEFTKQYEAGTLANETTLNNATDKNVTAKPNGPHLFAVRVIEGGADPDRIQFFGATNKGTAVDPPMAAPGAYVVIREQNSDNATTAEPQISFRNNGRVFRLASKVDGQTGLWDLSPDFDLQPLELGADGIAGTSDDVPDYTLDPGASGAPSEIQGLNQSDRATAWIIGKPALDPTSASGGGSYSGVAQDIGLLQFEMTLDQ